MTWRRLALASLAVALPTPRAQADALDRVLARGELVHCGDAEGSAPYAYPDPGDPSRLVGLDVELAGLVAAELGVRARFQQGLWETLPELVRTERCDLVLNGFEWRRDRVDTLSASVPYYVYALTLLVPRDDPRLSGPQGLAHPPEGAPLRIGVLGGSTAETWLESHAAEALASGRLERVRYEGNTNAMREVENGKLDGTLQDTPIAAFYADRFPGLVARGTPVSRGHYVVYAAPGEARLIAAVDRALARAIRDGRWSEALARHRVLDSAQAELRTIVEHLALKEPTLADGPEVSTATRSADATPSPLPRPARPSALAYGGLLLGGAAMTVFLSVVSFPLAMVLGLVLALLHAYGPRPARWFVRLYVEVIRGTPLMLQLYFVFFFLPELGIKVPALGTAIAGLALNYGAYESEIYRGGLAGVPRGQLEAALALGMRRLQAIRRIIVPQALRTSIPPMVNDFIGMFKDTSVCSVVTVVELTKEFSVVSQSSGLILELMLMTGALYLLMSFPAAIMARRLESRLAGEAP